MPSDSVSQWLTDLKAGKADAAGELWQRYFERLVGLARKHLRGARRRVADEEDVALSAFDSFCRGAARGRFPLLTDRDDLWKLLVVITARKASDLVQHERCRKRGGGKIRGESAFLGSRDAESARAGLDQLPAREPTPEFAAQVAEECQRLLQLLEDPRLRVVALRKMEGYSNAEIARQLHCVTQTVERKLRVIRSIWAEGTKHAT